MMSAMAVFRRIAHAKPQGDAEDEPCGDEAAKHDGEGDEQDHGEAPTFVTAHIAKVKRGFNA